MDLLATENQKMIAQMIRDFGAKNIKPDMMKWDESQEFPVHVFKQLGELGLMGVLVPTEYGGSGFGYLEYVTAIAELSKIDGSIGLSMAAHNSLCTGHLLAFGNEEQKKKAEAYKAELDKSGAWDKPIVTEIAPFKNFYPAENYHQNYYNDNQNQGYCRFVIAPKVEKFEKVFKSKLKKHL